MKRRILAIILLVAVLMTAFASVSFAAEEKGTGLYMDGGQLKYFQNGKFTEATGMVLNPADKTWHYVENGIYKPVTGMVKCVQPNCSSTGKWYYVEKGDQAKVTGLVQSVQPGSSQGKWYYVVDGKQNKKATGMVKCVQPGSPQEGEWFYVVKGKLSKESGMVKCIQPNCSSTGKWYLVIKGKYTKETGLAPCIQPGDSKGKVYYLKEGKLYRKTGRVTDRCVNIKLKRGRVVSFSANKKAVKEVTFPTLKSLGIKGYSSSIDAKLDKELKNIITYLAKDGLNFMSMSDYDKASFIGLYIGSTYYYNSGSYTAESMLDKGYGTCFAYADLAYLMVKKVGVENAWKTAAGRHVDHSVKVGEINSYKTYGSQHKSVVLLIDGKYYDLDANYAFIMVSMGSPQMFRLEKISKSYANYLRGKSSSYKTIN